MFDLSSVVSLQPSTIETNHSGTTPMPSLTCKTFPMCQGTEFAQSLPILRWLLGIAPTYIPSPSPTR